MEIDDSTAEEDDINPNCYVLDIGTQGKKNMIWVRAEYIRMFEFAEKFYAENAGDRLPPCLVITGQPGIGKTFWRWYALRVCCAQRKPVIWYTSGNCWLFVEEGVFKQPTSFNARLYQTVVWTLIDSLDTPSGPPLELIARYTRHFVIYTSSPTPSRWAKVHQSMDRRVRVMNPWSRAEIHKAAPFRAENVSLTAINKIFDELGPTPRLCFGNTELLLAHRTILDQALNAFTLSDFEHISSSGRDLELDDVSHKMYMVKRPNVDMSLHFEVVTITPFVSSKIVARMRTLQRHELVNLFNRYSRLSTTKIMAGDVFEAYCHVVFSETIEFELVTMVRIGGQIATRTPGKNESQWHSSHTKFPKSRESEELNALRDTASSEMLRIVPSRVVDYSPGEVTDRIDVEAGVYYIPLDGNQVAIDSFILHNGILYLLQMTIAKEHGINDKLMHFLLGSLNGIPSKNCWRFIFVKPPLHILNCPVPKSEDLLSLTLYSAEVEMR